MTRLSLAATFLGLGLAACSSPGPGEATASASAAVIGGTPDTTDRAVVYIEVGGFDDQWCTGTLLGPNLVLTNRICIASAVTGAFGDCASPGSATIGAPIPVSEVIVVGDDVVTSTPVVSAAVSQILVPSDDAACGYNVALLVLASTLDPSFTPLVPALEHAPTANETFEVVGYGNVADGGGDGTRRSATLTATCLGSSCDPGIATGLEFDSTVGVTGGDIGGPALLADKSVFGVAATYNGSSASSFERVDALGAFLQAGAKTAATAGGYAPPAWATTALPEAGADDAAAETGTTPAADGGDSGAKSDSGGTSGSSGSSGSSGGSSGGGGDAGSGESGAPSPSSGGCACVAAPTDGTDGALAIAAVCGLAGIGVRRRRLLVRYIPPQPVHGPGVP